MKKRFLTLHVAYSDKTLKKQDVRTIRLVVEHANPFKLLFGWMNKVNLYVLDDYLNHVIKEDDNESNEAAI